MLLAWYKHGITLYPRVRSLLFIITLLNTNLHIMKVHSNSNNWKIHFLALFLIFTLPLFGQEGGSYHPTACDDGNPCTTDIIDDCGNCFHIKKNCDDGDPSTIDYCDENGDCQHDPIACDDGDPCTTDVIDIHGNCLHFANNCDDGDPTTKDYCDEYGNCQNTPIVCDDGDPTTEDYLDEYGVCHHVQSACCDDNDPCTVDYIDPDTGECVHAAKDCDDGNPCTTDSCDPYTGECVHTNICDDNDPCTIDSCDPYTGECIHTPKDCDDGNPCTIDSCDPYTGACIHTPIDCDDGDPCTIDTCDPYTGECVHTPKDCDDGNPCTIDSCDPYTGECIHTPIDCDDGDPCTIDSCDPHTGECVHTPKDCDDGDPCTIDSCDPHTGECVHEPNPACEEICTFTQGFYGNAGGYFNGMPTIAIISDALSSGPLVIGVLGERSLTINYQNANCIIELLPGGGPSVALPDNLGDLVLGTDCDPSPIPVKPNSGTFDNVLLNQTITLSLNVRFDDNLGGLPLSSSCISLSDGLANALGANATVQDLLDYANQALAGLVNSDLNAISDAASAINEYFDECNTPCIGSGGAFIQNDNETNSMANPRGNSIDSDESSALNTFRIYPNPTKDFVNIDLQQFKTKAATIQIFSSFGQLIHEQKFNSLPDQIIELSTSEFGNGVYEIIVSINGSQRLNQSFLVHK